VIRPTLTPWYSTGDPSETPSARWAVKNTGIVGLAKSLAGWSPNFRIIHPRKISAPSTTTPTRMFLR